MVDPRRLCAVPLVLLLICSIAARAAGQGRELLIRDEPDLPEAAQPELQPEQQQPEGAQQQREGGAQQQQQQGQQERPRQQPAACANTRQGPWLVADDAGRVCARAALDAATGCCPARGSPLHSCDTCDLADGCCGSYEHCVSCCLAPAREPGRRRARAYRGLGKPETGRWATEFEACAAACRTSSRSTQHENAFILEARKHCFSERGRPLEPAGPGGPPPALPRGAEAVAGAPGASCDAACAAAGRACDAALLPSLDGCNALRGAFRCEAGCMGSAAGAAFPAYVGGGAAKAAWPASCQTLAPRAAAANCSASAEHVERLCPCVEAPRRQQQPQKQPAETAVTGAAATEGDDGGGGGEAGSDRPEGDDGGGGGEAGSDRAEGDGAGDRAEGDGVAAADEGDADEGAAGGDEGAAADASEADAAGGEEPAAVAGQLKVRHSFRAVDRLRLEIGANFDVLNNRTSPWLGASYALTADEAGLRVEASTDEVALVVPPGFFGEWVPLSGRIGRDLATATPLVELGIDNPALALALLAASLAAGKPVHLHRKELGGLAFSLPTTFRGGSLAPHTLQARPELDLTLQRKGWTGMALDLAQANIVLRVRED